MKKLILAIALASASVGHSLPLDPWTQWNADHPYVAKQVPPRALVARGIGTNDYYVLEVDPATGALPVNASVSVAINYEGPIGDPVPGDGAYIAGVNPSGELTGVSVTEDGEVNTVVTASALPTGAATLAKQDSQISIMNSSDTKLNNILGLTTLIEADTESIRATNASIDTKTTSIVTAVQGIKTDTNSLNLSMNTNNSELSAIKNLTTDIMLDVDAMNNKVPTLGQNVMAQSTPVTIASNQSAIPVTQAGSATEAKQDATIAEIVDTNAKLDDIYASLQVIETNATVGYVTTDRILLNYATTTVSTGSFVEILAATSAESFKMTTFEGSGQGMILASGASGSEVEIMYIPPGGIDGQFDLHIPAGTRLSIKAISGNANAGRLIVNIMGKI